MTNIDRRTIRAFVLNTTDTDRCRITRNDTVHAYGRMPNSIKTGWWFVGYAEDVLRSAIEDRADKGPCQRQVRLGCYPRP
jgi:hypothetical protein